ncbi:MAG: 50S ribosomal protein L25 [Deltaproteobacteria bacterium HGW-Deltaproteobacteria-19]|jgi:large subunit ribosomal protein L25|nr:MAG: 50S ribosomal protein L25 [Deltaproteobacteria bacterium HGW-Deltaproteobacteria-19]
MEVMELRAEARTGSGKGPARRLRSQGKIPAVFYGGGADSVPISVSSADLRKLLKSAEENVFVKLVIDDAGKKAEKLSLIKELQIDPATRKLFHADFCEVSMDHKMTFDVSLHFTGTPVGTQDGGEMLHLKRDVRVSCLPGLLPQFIEVDVTGLKIGDSLKVADLKVAEGVALVDGEDTAIVTVMAPRVAEAVEPEAGEEGTKEPEVLKQKVREE